MKMKMKGHTHIGFFNSVLNAFECSCGALGRDVNNKVLWTKEGLDK